MPFEIKGIGTIYYGQRDFRPDGTFITTKWLIFLYFPVLPLCSHRLEHKSPPDGWSWFLDKPQDYVIHDTYLPNWKQVLYTYSYLSSVVAWVNFTISKSDLWFPHLLDKANGQGLVFTICMIPIPMPWILRYFAQRKIDGVKK